MPTRAIVTGLSQASMCSIERLPLGEVGRPDVEPEHLDHEVVELLAVHVQDDAVDVVARPPPR